MRQTILKLDEVLGEKIEKTKIECLTAPGENYGSLMLSVEVTTKCGKEMKIVAKTLPPNPKMQEMFDCPVSFPKEVAIYKTIVPTLRSFQKEHKVEKVIDFTAKYYGSRLNVHGKNDKIDEHAVLLLENLKLSGFVNLDRMVGFDLEGSKLILTNLAHLHGVGIALNLQEPEVFTKTIKPYLTPFSVSKEVRDDLEAKYLNIINSIPELEPYLERLKNVSVDIYPPPEPREPWGTISHNDCWVNNTMVRLENGKPIESKLVDFQISDYGSPAKDVLFFLFSSVQNAVLRVNCDVLIRYYHNTLVSVLSKMGCDVNLFSYEKFQEELDFEARHTQFAHTVLMLFPIFAPKGTINDMADIKPEDIGTHEPTEEHKEKFVMIVEEFAKRNWI